MTMRQSDMVEATGPAWYIEGEVTRNGPIQQVCVPTGRFQIGRRSDVNLCLANPRVSKIHAELIASERAILVRDLHSTNGTYVNGQRIAQDTSVSEWDVIQFADHEFVVGRASNQYATCTMDSIDCDSQGILACFHQLMSERSVIPYFQPIVRYADNQLIGYEVLARSAISGMSNPRDMFAAAERTGLAASLSVMCRENGVEIARKLVKPGLLFVNTHPSERAHAGLLESLIHLRTMAPGLDLVVELHEEAVTQPREIAELRSELRSLGIQLAYDDFGAGKARLMELAEVAPDYLKFDIGLIRDIHLAPQRQQMVAGLVRMVRELGIQPLAEGIEQAAEAEVCRQIGFTHAQGYFHGRPTAAEFLP